MLQRVDMLFYLDAGTGSMLVQMAVAGAAGAAVMAKVGWSKVSGPFRRKTSDDAVQDEAERGEHVRQSPDDN